MRDTDGYTDREADRQKSDLISLLLFFKDKESGLETNRLMVFREINTPYCENHTKYTNTLIWQNEFLNSKVGGTYGNHRGLMVKRDDAAGE
jgi:hypothetical protein